MDSTGGTRLARTVQRGAPRRGTAVNRKERSMSAVLTALYSNHETAEQVRTRLVQDGFPTDRVQLTSRQELGQADVAPAKELPEKLKQYFHQLFQNERAQRSAQRLERAVLDGGAVIAVHPRGDVETQRALALMEDSGPVEFRASDL